MRLADLIPGDLGLTPTDVEAKLQQVFRLAQAWDCVMLLDEADIFLAQRTATDTERNALVSGKGVKPCPPLPKLTDCFSVPSHSGILRRHPVPNYKPGRRLR